MSKPTPGPWRLELLPKGKRGGMGGYLILGADGLPFMSQLPEGQEANARLIAAAPDLLEACKQAQCSCSMRERESGHLVECWMPDMLAAIKKAEGGE